MVCWNEATLLNLSIFKMAEIKDTGKVWIKGNVSPVFAIRVDDTFFVPGKEEDQTIEYRVEENYLCVDLHDTETKMKTVRRFDLGLTPTTPASLFSGFERTKHADVMVVTFEDAGVLEAGRDF